MSTTALYILYGLFLVVLLLKCIIMHKEIEDIRETMFQMKTDAYEDAKEQLDLLSKHVDGHSDLLHILDELRTRINELEERVDMIDDKRYDLQGKELAQKEEEPCE